MHQRSTISALPVELLSTIFQFVGQETHTPPCYQDHSQGIDEMDGLLTTRAPYSLAAVHLNWQRILSTIPELWTNIVILLDSIPQPYFYISAANAGVALSWSCNIRPITVVVTRRAGRVISLDDGRDYSEPFKGKLLAEALGKHVARCGVIYYDVVHSSTLPSIAFDILGREEFDSGLPDLTDLILKCCVDDGYMGTLVSSRIYIPKQLARTPSLRRLSMDGRNFVEIATHFSEWFATHHNVDITIAHFRSWDSTTKIFTLADALWFLEEIDSIGCLTLIDLEFSAPLLGLETNPDTSAAPDTNCLVLQDLGEAFMNQFSHILRIFETSHDSFKMKNCHFGDELQMENTTRLYLEDLHPAHGDLARFLRGYTGVHFSVTRCSSFTDQVLKELKNGRHPHYSRQLTIVDCENFTVAALKGLVASQCEYRKGMRQNDCHVSGRVPDISEEDRKWFGRHLKNFTWETKN